MMRSLFIKYIKFKFNTALKVQLKMTVHTKNDNCNKKDTSIHTNRHTVQIQFSASCGYVCCCFKCTSSFKWILNGCQCFYCLSAEKFKVIPTILFCFPLPLIKVRLLFSKKYHVHTRSTATHSFENTILTHTVR